MHRKAAPHSLACAAGLDGAWTGLDGTGDARPNKSPRRKPGDREPQGAEPVTCGQGLDGGAGDTDKLKTCRHGESKRVGAVRVSAGRIPLLALRAWIGIATGWDGRTSRPDGAAIAPLDS